MTERDLLVDCLERLNRAGAAYMLTGSMASNYWGVPRTTHDLDFVLQLPPTLVPRLTGEFSGDFHMDEAAVHSAWQPPHHFNAIDTRSALKVDFWLAQTAPFERKMFDRRIQITLFGKPAWIATAEDVILHKLVWNKIMPSDRQISDAAGVASVQQGSLDLGYMRHWADELGIRGGLEDILGGNIQLKKT